MLKSERIVGYRKGFFMDKLNFKLDKSRCIGCGRCIKDCSCDVLKRGDDGYPQVVEENIAKCMKCQHCFAVCPTGAISIFGKNPDKSLKTYKIQSPEAVLNLIQSRKSIRQFKQENLDRNTLKELKNMLPWIPTGCNNHSLAFTFVEDMESMKKFKAETYKNIEKMIEENPNTEKAKQMKILLDLYKSGKDRVFRNAPHALIVSSPVDAPCADIDPIIALSYFELYAQSLGVGTLWCGLLFRCWKATPSIVDELKLPDGYKPVYAMLFGVPDVKYERITQPEKYKIITYGTILTKLKSVIKDCGKSLINFVK